MSSSQIPELILPEEVIEKIQQLESELKELERVISLKNRTIAGLTSFILLKTTSDDSLNTDIFDLDFLEELKGE